MYPALRGIFFMLQTSVFVHNRIPSIQKNDVIGQPLLLLIEPFYCLLYIVLTPKV